MYKFGDLVYFDNIKLTGKISDIKGKRLCVVLCEYNNIVYFCPLFGDIDGFNENNLKHVEIDDVDYNNSFYYYVNMKKVYHAPSSLACDTGLLVDKKDEKELMKRILILSLDEINQYSKVKKLMSITGSKREKNSSEKMLSGREVFPNGTGRTKEEFEKEKEYWLKYLAKEHSEYGVQTLGYKMNKKQQ